MIKKFTLLFLLSLLTLASSQTDSLNMRLLGMWEPEDTSNHIYYFAVSGEYMFVATERITNDTVHIVNVSDPSSPCVVGKLPNMAGDLAVYDSFLYVGGAHPGIINISNPQSPHIEYTGPIVENMRALYPYENDGRIYLAVTCFVEVDGDRVPGIRVVDVTDPSRPELLDWYYVPPDTVDREHIPPYLKRDNLASISVLYPHLFVFETIEYIDTSWGGGYDHGYVQVKMFDLRDLSAPPVVWRSEEMRLDPYVGLLFLGASVGDGDIYILGGGYHYLRYTTDEIEEVCGSSTDESEYHLYPRCAVGDTYYVIGYGRGLMGVIWGSGCVIDTLGYYGVEGLDHYISCVRVEDERIYVNTQRKVYILSWGGENVWDRGVGVESDYRIYPSPVVMGCKVEINMGLDRAGGIYDISGKLRRILEPGVREIDTRGLSPGVYFLISDDKRIKLKFVVI